MGKKKKKVASEPGVRQICANKRARRDYEIEDRLEAGIVLRGSEVKSLRAGGGSLNEAYCMVDDNDEAWLISAHIPEYEWANLLNHAPRRRRKLLLHGREIRRLAIRTRERGYSLIPLRIYFRDAHVKVEIGVGKGRKRYDKREVIKKRDQDRDMERSMR